MEASPDTIWAPFSGVKPGYMTRMAPAAVPPKKPSEQRYAEDAGRRTIGVPADHRYGVWFAHFCNEVALMMIQVQELMEQGNDVLEAIRHDPDKQRAVLHLGARLEGMAKQLDEMAHVTKRRGYGHAGSHAERIENQDRDHAIPY